MILCCVGFVSGCSTNHAKITHGMRFAQIEDSLQQQFKTGMNRSEVESIATDDLRLELSRGHEVDDSRLIYQLKPKRDGWGNSKHRSHLYFEFESDMLAHLVYRNYWGIEGVPHGKTEIALIEVQP